MMRERDAKIGVGAAMLWRWGKSREEMGDAEGRVSRWWVRSNGNGKGGIHSGVGSGDGRVHA